MIRPHAFSFEYLEPRQMLAAHPFAPGLAIAAAHANDHAQLPSLVSSALAGSSQNEHTNLLATVSDPAHADVIGTVHFMAQMHHGNTTTRLMANIEGAEPNAMLPVVIDGVTVEAPPPSCGNANDNGNGAPVWSLKKLSVAAAELVPVFTSTKVVCQPSPPDAR